MATAVPPQLAAVAVLIVSAAPSRGHNSTSRRPFQRAPRATVPPSTRGRLTKGRRFFARSGRGQILSHAGVNRRPSGCVFNPTRHLDVGKNSATHRASLRALTHESSWWPAQERAGIFAARRQQRTVAVGDLTCCLTFVHSRSKIGL